MLKKNLLVWLLLALFILPLSVYPRYTEALIRPVNPEAEEEEVVPGPADEKLLRILVNGVSIHFDSPPYIKNGRTMVPVRFVSEELGARVAWDGGERKVTVTKDDKEIVFFIDQTTVWINGRERADLLDVPAEISHDRTMVPLRFVGETLEARVDWDGEKRLVTVDTAHLITLYFADEQAAYLVPEQREIWGVNPRNIEDMSRRVFHELLKGPERPELHRTIHDSGKRNILVVLTGELPYTGTLILNLTSDFVDEQKARGMGTAGETMAVYSMVNSLCELPGVERVKFLEEGREVESLFGHIATDQPVRPRWDLVQR